MAHRQLGTLRYNIRHRLGCRAVHLCLLNKSMCEVVGIISVHKGRQLPLGVSVPPCHRFEASYSFAVFLSRLQRLCYLFLLDEVQRCFLSCIPDWKIRSRLSLDTFSDHPRSSRTSLVKDVEGLRHCAHDKTCDSQVVVK